MKSSRVYLFCSKLNTIDFEVPAAPNGRLPVDQAAGLLAMHCLARGQSPSYYRIMIHAPLDTKGLAAKAEKLLEVSHYYNSNVKLTDREKQVLAGILRSRANKEIASEMNIAERTVKFHVKSLFVKFNVRSRVDLARVAAARGSN